VRRAVLYLVMLALLMTVLARPLTGDWVHEAAGVLLLAMLAAHTVAKRRWYLALSKGPWSLRRAASAAVNLSLIAAMTTVLVTAVPISRFVFGFLAIDNGMWVAQLHIAAALWLFVLASVHLGFHWEPVKRVLPLPADGAVTSGGRVVGCGPAELCRPGVAGPLPASIRSGLLILACGFGARACFNRNIGSKLIMYYSFDFFRAGDSVAGFIIDYLNMMVLFACVAHCVINSMPARPSRA